MKFSRTRVAFFAALGLSTPVLVLAAVQQFKGPSQTPPLGNVPGVIWNSFGSGQPQPNAEINITGKATVGSDLAASTLTGGQDKMNQILGDNKLQLGKAFRVDQLGSANYYMGNWGGAGGSSQPLTMNFFGDVKADRIAPFVGPGNEGRVQARKFCFFPGNPADCLTTWPGSGLYVQKIGDVMTGNLTFSMAPNTTAINASGGSAGGSFAGSLWGLEAISDNYAVYAHTKTPGIGTAVHGFNGAQGGLFDGKTMGVQGNGTDVNVGFGGKFEGGNTGVQGIGKTYAVDAYNSSAGIGTAVHGYNGAIGGEFTGKTYGVKASGSFGNSFSDSNGNNTVILGGPSGAVWTKGNIQATNNLLENCAWTAAVADGAQLLCPAATPILNGIKKGAGTTQAYCCKL